MSIFILPRIVLDNGYISYSHKWCLKRICYRSTSFYNQSYFLWQKFNKQIIVKWSTYVRFVRLEFWIVVIFFVVCLSICSIYFHVIKHTLEVTIVLLCVYVEVLFNTSGSCGYLYIYIFRVTILIIRYFIVSRERSYVSFNWVRVTRSLDFYV